MLLEQVVVTAKSVMQKIVAISGRETEVIALVMHVQEILYIMKINESIELKVKKLMKACSDNKGVVDLANEWNVAGNTKHTEVRIM